METFVAAASLFSAKQGGANAFIVHSCGAAASLIFSVEQGGVTF